MIKLTKEQKEIIKENTRYTEEDIENMVNGYDWESIIEEAKQNIERDYDDNLIGRAYLGSLINPSGKYYLPFASSNVEVCALCNGKGCLWHKSTDKSIYAEYQLFRERLFKLYNQEYNGMWDKFPKHIQTELTSLYNLAKLHESESCPLCNGVGSHEAWADELWQELMDSKASEMGGWIEAGEGDPCDTFFCVHIDDNSEEE